MWAAVWGQLCAGCHRHFCQKGQPALRGSGSLQEGVFLRTGPAYAALQLSSPHVLSFNISNYVLKKQCCG